MRKMNLESITVLAYTAVNLRVLWPFISNSSTLIGVSANGNHVLQAIILSLFLNAGLILIWLRKSQKDSP